jgi:phage gp46-like protein
MDFQITYDYLNPNGVMTWGDNSNLSTDIFNSLNIKQGSFFQNLSFGSKLYTIKTLSQAQTLIVQQYAEQALGWMLTAGYATEIDATCSIQNNAYVVGINVTQASGIEQNYSFNMSLNNGTFLLVGPQ